jgi:hypothetical protein
MTKMNAFNVATVPTFSDFIAEVTTSPPLGIEPEQIVRLLLSESRRSTQGLPVTEVTLDLQGFNGGGMNDLVWLSQSTTIPGYRRDGAYQEAKLQARYEAMSDLHDVVQDRLEALGYRVLPGRYVLPSDLQPINGRFDCAVWYEDDDGLPAVRADERN